jgi:hypothetical protein
VKETKGWTSKALRLYTEALRPLGSIKPEGSILRLRLYGLKALLYGGLQVVLLRA